VVNKIQIYEDKTLKREMQTLAILQEADERLAAIKGKVTAQPFTFKDRYKLQDNVLYCREGNDQNK
jgi:hypothetical protein